MNFAQSLANLFHMTDEVWQRHTNPWSAWTRFICLPLLVIAVWSRVVIGWGAMIPTLLIIGWIWINPRFFPKPKSTRNWASKAVLGERVWLNQKKAPIPKHHKPIILWSNGINTVGFFICMFGLIKLLFWPTLLGLSWVILGKTWFLDRMVWLMEEMKDHPQYQGWLY